MVLILAASGDKPSHLTSHSNVEPRKLEQAKTLAIFAFEAADAVVVAEWESALRTCGSDSFLSDSLRFLCHRLGANSSAN